MDIKETAIRAAREAGRLLRENLGHAISVEYKGEIDLVTEMDKRAEECIVGLIHKNFPDHGILAEEGGEQKSTARAHGARWIIDPLDGTTNYAHGLPTFCVSIAFEESGKVRLGVVYDPMGDELFTAEEGKGATLNGRAIKVSSTRELSRALLATGFPYDIRSSPENNLDNFSRFAVKAQAIRRPGSAALDLSYVACGRFDGFWELKLKPWDVAAASLIAREAGGKISDFRSKPFSIYGIEALATNGHIHEEMVAILQQGS
ncbi:MAG: inositol monophosphatase family protein [Thermodesulfobacteriota bacterium]